MKQGRIERRTENEGREEGITIMKEGETEDEGARKGERKGWGAIFSRTIKAIVSWKCVCVSSENGILKKCTL